MFRGESWTTFERIKHLRQLTPDGAWSRRMYEVAHIWAWDAGSADGTASHYLKDGLFEEMSCVANRGM